MPRGIAANDGALGIECPEINVCPPKLSGDIERVALRVSPHRHGTAARACAVKRNRRIDEHCRGIRIALREVVDQPVQTNGALPAVFHIPIASRRQ